MAEFAYQHALAAELAGRVQCFCVLPQSLFSGEEFSAVSVLVMFRTAAEFLVVREVGSDEDLAAFWTGVVCFFFVVLDCVSVVVYVVKGVAF